MAGALAGCAGWQAYREGHASLARGDIEQGLARLEQATREAPDNTEYRRELIARRESIVRSGLQEGAGALDQRRFSQAQDAFARVLRVEPRQPQALAGLARTERAEALHERLDQGQKAAQAGDFAGATEIAAGVLREDPLDRRAQSLARAWSAQARIVAGAKDGPFPKLRAAYRKPVSLMFRDASLTQVFESLKQASGINFIFDKDVRSDSRLTIGVTNKPLEDVIRVILAGQRLVSRTLDDDTLLIYPNTPEKARDYQEIVIRTFYLSNADAAKVVNLVRNVVKARDVHVDEKMNLVVVRDTADVVRLAERVIANVDMADPEVMLELEVLEVSYSKLREVGIRWPDAASATVSGAAGPGALTYDEFRNRHSGMVSFALPNPLLAVALKQSGGDVNVLSNPRIRVRNKQTAKVLVGERVPVITTTSTINIGTSESVSYLDVGLKLEIEPSVSLDDEVSMRVTLEVSNINGVVTRSSGLQAFRIGTRNAATQLRVRDGETQVLAGLIQREDRRSASGVPYLADLPLIGRLFANTTDNDSRSEVILLITPRVVRSVTVPGPEQLEILSGTEVAQGARPIQLGAPSTPPSAGGHAASGLPDLRIPTASHGASPAVTGAASSPFSAPPSAPPPTGPYIPLGGGVTPVAPQGAVTPTR